MALDELTDDRLLDGRVILRQPAQGLRRPRIPGEQRALHGVRQVGQRENGPVEIREIGRERGAFLEREFRHGVRVH